MGITEADLAALQSNLAAGRLRSSDKATAERQRWDETLTLVVHGAPRTKKNSGQIGRDAAGKPHVFPSKAYAQWAATARLDWNGIMLSDRPWNCAALFFRDAERGDAVGYYQALADLLESRGVLSDDKLIVSWDGTRLRKDADSPRVFVTLTPVTP